MRRVCLGPVGAIVCSAILAMACGATSDAQKPQGKDADNAKGGTNASPGSGGANAQGGQGNTTSGQGGRGGATNTGASGGTAPGIAGKGNEPCVEPATVQIPAWGITNSGVYVKSGATVKITATGAWKVEGKEVGPAGSDDCDGGLGVRVAKFFDRQCVGTDHEFVAKRDGYLWFFQDTISDGYDQVEGALSVTISGGDSCSGQKPEGMLSVFDDPDFDKQRLVEFEKVCGNIPVLFETDSPDSPLVQTYIKDFMGGDPEAYLKKAVVVACAVNYGTTELAAHHGEGTMRLVHYLGAQKWEDLGKPKHKDAKGEEYWDFALSFKVEELADMQHYGRFGAVPSTLLHETGHVLSPVGRVEGAPRWINETYADLLADKMGYDVHNHDNPENWVLWSRTTPYCSGYGTGSLFLEGMERMFPGFIHKLSAFIVGFPPAKWPGSEAAFQAAAGQSLEKSFADYLKAYELTLKKPVAECDFPNDMP